MPGRGGWLVQVVWQKQVKATPGWSQQGWSGRSSSGGTFSFSVYRRDQFCWCGASAGKTASQVGFYWLLPEVLRGCQSYLLTARGDSQLQALQRGPWSPVLPSPLPFSPQTRKTCLTSLSPHFPLSVHLWENRPSQGRGEVTAAPTLMTSHPSTGRLGRDTLRHGSPAPMLAPPRWE